ncbi:IgGFc-binding protein-like [Discoglossus pictus]
MGTLYSLLLLMGILTAGQAQRSFVTAFLENISRTSSTTLELHIVTYDKAATVSISVSQQSFNHTVVIDRDSSSAVTIGYEYMIYERQPISKAVIVTSDEDISVYAFYTNIESADAMACLPQGDLGTEYYIFTSGKGTANQFAVANGGDNAVWVNITVSGSLILNGVQYENQDTFTFSLGYQQVIQFQSTNDLTGTRVTASASVAVFSGNKCFTGPSNACDVLVEQLYPVQSWGRLFAVFPLLNHTQDIVDVMAANADTLVTTEGPEGEITQYNLQQGSHVKLNLIDSVLVKSSKPVMVSYLFQQSVAGLVIGYDPFFTSIPSMVLTRNYYKFITKEIYHNYILIVSEASSASDFYLDHKPMDLQLLPVSEINGIRGWEVYLGKIGGQHEIYHKTDNFTLLVYGIEKWVSYGYSLGQERTYPDPPLSSPTEEPESPAALRCLSHGAVYQLPLSVVFEAHLGVHDIHLEDPQCQAEQEGNVAVIKVPFNRCGSRVLDEGGKTLYVNTVYGTIPGTSIHRIEVPVSCEMERNETLGFNLHPKVTDVVSQGHYNVSLKLYNSEAFDDLITLYPFEIDLPGNVYVEFKVESDDKNLQIFAENCKSSPSLEDGDQSYSLIEHGCSQDSTLHSHPVSDHRVQRISFHLFKFDDLPEVYLACNVIICHGGSSPNRCSQGCINRRHRRAARSPRHELASARLSQGPIVFKQDGRPQRILGERPFPSLVFVAVICGLGLVAVGALMLQRRYYKTREYSLLPDTDCQQ